MLYMQTHSPLCHHNFLQSSPFSGLRPKLGSHTRLAVEDAQRVNPLLDLQQPRVISPPEGPLHIWHIDICLIAIRPHPRAQRAQTSTHPQQILLPPRQLAPVGAGPLQFGRGSNDRRAPAGLTALPPASHESGVMHARPAREVLVQQAVRVDGAHQRLLEVWVCELGLPVQPAGDELVAPVAWEPGPRRVGDIRPWRGGLLPAGLVAGRAR